MVRVGYNDILGQLVFPLEKFSNVQFINFTIVAVLIAVFILCIRPRRLLFATKSIRKNGVDVDHVSMLTIGFCGLAVWMSGATKPAKVQVNQLEIIDFDAATKKVRGNVWTNIYSPSNTKCNVSPEPKKRAQTRHFKLADFVDGKFQAKVWAACGPRRHQGFSYRTTIAV